MPNEELVKRVLVLASNRRIGAFQNRPKALSQILEDAGIQVERHLIPDKADFDAVIAIWDSRTLSEESSLKKATAYAKQGKLISVKVGRVSPEAWQQMKNEVQTRQHFDLQHWNEKRNSIDLSGLLSEIEQVLSYPPILQFIEAKNGTWEQRWNYAKTNPAHPSSQDWAKQYELHAEENITTQIEAFEDTIDKYRSNIEEASKNAIRLNRDAFETWRKVPFSERAASPPNFSAPDLTGAEGASDITLQAIDTAANLSRELRAKDEQLKQRKYWVPAWSVCALLALLTIGGVWVFQSVWESRSDDVERKILSEADKETYVVLAETQRDLEVKLDEFEVDSDARNEENYNLFAEYLKGCWERGDAVIVPCDRVEFVFPGNMNVERHCYRGEKQSSFVSTVGRNYMELANGALFFRPKNPNVENSDVNEIWWGSRVYRENDDYGYAGIYRQIEGVDTCSG